jgi:hypothetical protein
VNYNYVKVLAKKRRQIIKETLEATLNYFPDEVDSQSFHSEIAQTIETFFLLDHCVEADEKESNDSGRLIDVFKTPKKYHTRHSSVDEAAKQTTTKDDTKQKLSFKLDNPIESVESVKNAVGNAVDHVGHFLKQKVAREGNEKSKGRGLATIDTSIDTSASPNTSYRSLRSPVVPYTRKERRSRSMRDNDEDELNEVGEDATLLLDDDRAATELVPSYSHPVPTFRSRGSKLGDLVENNLIIFSLIALASVLFLKYVAKLTVTVDLDILLLLIWASFCIGLHTPRPMIGGIDKTMGPPTPPTPGKRASLMRRAHDRHGRKLLRMSMVSTPEAQITPGPSDAMTFDEIREEDEHDDIMDMNRSPLPKFPDDAKLGSHLNCWSEPVPESFHVRGAKYLVDKVKAPSGPFVFPVRGVDLFLTDSCPENAGSNTGVMGGHLRDKPTFIINFRLPWGILLTYFEIPERFLPFLRAGHEPDFDKSTLPSMDEMNSGDRCAARFLQGSEEHKNSTLKIVPVVVEGPWVVKSVVGGKPAIIGNKLPVNYFYQRAEDGKACYLEADLDIVASSAARGILSVTRTYTRVLTIDLGFVVQGNSGDELPEQMLVGARLHGIDPLTAPPYPPSKDMFAHPTRSDDDDNST